MNLLIKSNYVMFMNQINIFAFNIALICVK